MTPSTLRAAVVAERVAWVREMLACVRGLPLGSADEFFSDARNVAAAESYLRRALEALLDLGRHVLAKGFGVAPSEYKEVARGLERVGVLTPDVARTLVVLAGYRNRMVHFYHEVGPQELYEVCSRRLGDVEDVLDAMLSWCRGHPERFDAPVE